jgi:tripartite-type tricarboxylate transporter receptor subunit TctC
MRVARRSFLIAAAGLALSQSRAAAAEFYAGKQIELIVSTEAGVVYDAYARLLARYMPAHIPGAPSIVVENMPGGGGLKAANYMAQVAARDGTVIAGTHSAVFTMSKVFPKQARFDERSFSWIGSVTRDPYLAVVRADVPIRDVRDARRVVVSIGGPSAGSLGVDMVAIANALLGTKFRIIAGYKDPKDVLLAIQRREVDGAFAVSWSELGATGLVQQGKLRVIAQDGLTPSPVFGTAPLLLDLATSPEDRQALVFMMGRAEAARPYFAPPGVPPERLELLRRAFDATLADPGFRADAARMGLAVDGSMTGARLASFVDQLLSTPQRVIDNVRMILSRSR